MKPFVLIGGLCALLVGITGCDTISDGMSGSLVNVPPQTRRFEAPQPQVYYAAQLALKRMDFVLTRTAQAQGIVEGRSHLRDTAVFGAARQFTAKIRLLGSEGGGTEVSILLHEQSEADFKGSASNRALREHGLYESYFEHLTRILQEQAPAVNP
jgi:hypothetical protein